MSFRLVFYLASSTVAVAASAVTTVYVHKTVVSKREEKPKDDNVETLETPKVDEKKSSPETPAQESSWNPFSSVTGIVKGVADKVSKAKDYVVCSVKTCPEQQKNK